MRHDLSHRVARAPRSNAAHQTGGVHHHVPRHNLTACLKLAPRVLHVLVAIAMTVTLSFAAARAAGATVERGVSEDQVEAATEKLANAMKRYQKSLTRPSADWASFVTILDQRVSALRSSYDKWSRVLDAYIPEHLGEGGVPILGRLQVAIRTWVPDQEALLAAMHVCVDPLDRPVDATLARSCVQEFVAANLATFQEHEAAIQSVLRSAKRTGLLD